ncbi:hypothetical protein AQUCO_01800168v1 [Aquilegia coerulea]|uniref:Uncharacterized protein n=1 Tax=Aquilegia coerulea TaxID=218851 RepID=A0A2G5DKZ7_AQUCA|nr:hypothetical protein AQUCO_01800168v1 [Aquilegia coerulea]
MKTNRSLMYIKAVLSWYIFECRSVKATLSKVCRALKEYGKIKPEVKQLYSTLSEPKVQMKSRRLMPK